VPATISRSCRTQYVYYACMQVPYS